MNKFTIQFIEIGRNKKTWFKTFETQPTDDDLVYEIRRSKALLSNDVSVSRGLVFAGIRCVGEYKIAGVTS